MNYNYPNRLEEINRQKIQQDMAFILKEGMLKPKSAFFDAIGSWMVASGERLRRRYAASAQMTLGFLQDNSRIFKA